MHRMSTRPQRSWAEVEAQILIWEGEAMEFEKRAPPGQGIGDDEKMLIFFDMLPPADRRFNLALSQ